jgi:alpha-glucosidase
MLLLLALPGTALLYGGQELGLEEVDLPDALRQDPIFARTGGARVGRDGCRVPLPWTGVAPAFGFTDGQPWLPMPADWGGVSAAAQHDDPSSMLSLVRAAIARRPGGPFAWRNRPDGVLAFDRGDTHCIVNVSGEPVALPETELLLSSEPLDRSLPAGAAAWFRPL